MSNEELAAAIQVGDTSQYLNLWEQVRGWAATMAFRWNRSFYGRAGVQIDDLMQCAFLALVEAVATFDGNAGAFTTWYTYALKTAFCEAYGIRTQKDTHEPLNNALSLDAPLTNDDEITLIETIPDPHNLISGVDNADYIAHLHNDLEEMLDVIPKSEANVLRGYFFGEKTVKEIADSANRSTEEIGRLRNSGLRSMRSKVNTRQGAKLRAYIEEKTPYYMHTGVSSFNANHTSVVEQIVLYRENLEKRFADYQQ